MPASTPQLREFLLNPRTWPDRPRRVRLAQTHISEVYLTDRFAFKLKKPVRFDFLDYSTPELRHRACQAEVRLNRRLAPDVYLGVLAVVRRADGSLGLGAGDNLQGEPIDWLVQMRKLPLDRTLDAAIRRGTLDDADVRRAADLLTGFYLGAPPVDLAAEDYRRQLERHVAGNLQELFAPRRNLAPEVVRRVHGFQLRMLALAAERFDERVGQGRIVEGHGDLRPEHVCLVDPPVVIDCIEFNDEFRTLDVVDELGFLAMECDALGAHGVGQQFLDSYLQASGDAASPPLMAFYQSYRACVRSKVAALRADQLEGSHAQRAVDEARRYLQLADRYIAPHNRPPLLVVRGLMGTGKTTLAAELANRLGVEHLATDAIRRSTLGASDQPAQYDAGNYAPAAKQRVYELMFAEADRCLAEGLSVVLDATFLLAAPRTSAIELAGRHNAPVLIVECRCPDDEARRRIAERAARGDSPSEARAELLDRQRRDQQPAAPGEPTLVVDTTAPLAQQVEAVLGRMKEDWISA